MINIQDLEFRYRDGGFHLRIPGLTIEKRVTAAVIGPSGTGKTTLLNLIAGVSIPQSGQIETAGTQITGMSDTERRGFRIQTIGLVFQEFELIEHLHVLDNILLPYRISPALDLDARVRKRAADLANEVGMSDKLRRNVKHLSQGERQRVAICRALLPEPPLLLCDEPTGNLDPDNKDHVLDLLFDYVERNDTTLVAVTHDHEILDRFQRTIDFKEFSSQITQMSVDKGNVKNGRR